MNRVARIRTLSALGWRNLTRVGLYRAGLYTGLHSAQRVAARPPCPPFFEPTSRITDLPANTAWQNKLRWYDWREVPHDGSPPDWFAHPFEVIDRTDLALPWWRIPDFADGDIKNLWELSRFSWAPAMATMAANGDQASIDRLNAWLSSWVEANPPYLGPNWKCGQEASIRVIHLLTAALVLRQDRSPQAGLVELVRVHMQRIAPTVSYAIGQQNNHGTTEAAALFAGGAFLDKAGDTRGERWSRLGRRLLEDRARILIEPDGSFSQYSLNYHRLMLDAYAFAEAWRRRHALSPLSVQTLQRLRAATDWFDTLIDRPSGDAPNLGANDGARLIPLTATDYRDFRPSLQLASVLFRGARAITTCGQWDDSLRWLGVEPAPSTAPVPESRTFDDGGCHVLRVGGACALLRYPRFRFRPSQADALHLDLWVDGRNLLRDGGSFSYNDPTGIGSFLAGTAAHNTIEFDGRDQMPRLGRFLFGNWLVAFGVEPIASDSQRTTAAAGYRGRRGVTHHRRIGLSHGELRCVDAIDGRFAVAILRWRLAPGEYKLEGQSVMGERLQIMIAAHGRAPELKLTDAPESRYYQQHERIPVLEVRLTGAAMLTTTARFAAAPEFREA